MRRLPNPLPRLKAEWSGSGLATTAFGAVGFSFGIGVATLGVTASPASAAFSRTPQFSIWCAVTGFEVALWAMCWMTARGIGKTIRAQLPRAPRWPFVVVILALIAAARAAFLLYPTVHTPVYGMAVRQIVLQCVGILAAVPALSGIWRIQTWLRSPAATDVLSPLVPVSPGRTVSDLVAAREWLQRLLLVLSLMIGAVVFATGALRNAFVAGGFTAAGFPATVVLLFGALFTAALGLLFVPAYTNLRAFQRRVRDKLSRVPDDGLPSQDWHSERERLSALLGLNSGLLDAARAAPLLLGPFLSALITLFLPDLKP